MPNNVLNDFIPAPVTDAKHKRDDKDGESFMQNAQRKAAADGNQVMMKNGKLIIFKETDLESKAPVLTITDGVTPIITGKFRTTCQGKFASAKLQHHDPKTGKLTTCTFTPSNPPKGTKAVLNIREKPEYEGEDDDYKKEDPTIAIGTGAPGSEGLSLAQLESTALSKLTSVVGGIEANVAGAEAQIATIQTTIGKLV